MGRLEDLHDRSTMLAVCQNDYQILKARDSRCAVGVQDHCASTCLLLMGTTPRSAIIVSQIVDLPLDGIEDYNSDADSTVEGSAWRQELLYMQFLRKLVNVSLQHSDEFQMPLAFLVFSEHSDEMSFSRILRRTTTAFRHLRIEVEVFSSECFVPLDRSMTGKDWVVARRGLTGTPEIYIWGNLVWPKMESGPLSAKTTNSRLHQIGRDYTHEGEGKGEDHL